MKHATPSAAVERLALQAAAAAELLQISERHFWSLHSSGRVPRPVRLGRAVRWSAAELRDWLAAGAPSREVWEQAKGGGR